MRDRKSMFISAPVVMLEKLVYEMLDYAKLFMLFPTLKSFESYCEKANTVNENLVRLDSEIKTMDEPERYKMLALCTQIQTVKECVKSRISECEKCNQVMDDMAYRAHSLLMNLDTVLNDAIENSCKERVASSTPAGVLETTMNSLESAWKDVMAFYKILIQASEYGESIKETSVYYFDKMKDISLSFAYLVKAR